MPGSLTVLVQNTDPLPSEIDGSAQDVASALEKYQIHTCLHVSGLICVFADSNMHPLLQKMPVSLLLYYLIHSS